MRDYSGARGGVPICEGGRLHDYRTMRPLRSVWLWRRFYLRERGRL